VPDTQFRDDAAQRSYGAPARALATLEIDAIDNRHIAKSAQSRLAHKLAQTLPESSRASIAMLISESSRDSEI